MSLYTKKQALMVLASMGVHEPLPKRGKAVIVVWPKPAQPNHLKVVKADVKGTYGDALYDFTYSTL